MTDLSTLITAYTALFIIIDPLGLAPLFVALTQGMTPAQRRSVAFRSIAIAAVLMMIFLFAGQAVLDFLGISLPAFQIAGGVLLFLTALEILFQKRQSRREDNAQEGQSENIEDPSVFPLAMPLIVGPGAIATLILLTSKAQSFAEYAAIGGVTLAVLAITFLAFMTAGPIERILGKTGLNILTRVLGMLLAALATQFIVDGIRQSFTAV